MEAWLLALVAALAAAAFAYLWGRGRALVTKADLERQAAERAARTAEGERQRQAALLSALHLAQTDAVLLIDAERVVRQHNPAAASLFNLKPAPGQTLIVATRSVELDELAAHVLAGGEDNDRQVNLNGLPYRARAVPADAHGLAIVVKDLSELQRLGRARRDFIANISHELRTPLTSIRLLVESQLTGAAPEPAQMSALLSKISTEVQALEQMAQELLDLAQIESGQSIVRLLPTPIEQIVHTAVDRLRPQAEHKRQQLSVVVPGDLIALADADMLSRVLGNLLHNAIKFTPPDGAVLVQAQKQDEDILIRVADSGPGIPPADLPRVFERFFRGDRSRQSSGTGLGLAIAKHVVEAHGGRIWVENHSVDGYPGAAFNFTLLTAEDAA